jgi:hypothetical protein
MRRQSFASSVSAALDEFGDLDQLIEQFTAAQHGPQITGGWDAVDVTL